MGRLKHGDDAHGGVCIKTNNCFVMLSEGGFNLAGRAIAAADPNYFRWKTQDFAHFAEIRVLRDECESVLASVIPENCVGGPIQPNGVNVGRVWVDVGEELDKPRR